MMMRPITNLERPLKYPRQRKSHATLSLKRKGHERRAAASGEVRIQVLYRLNLHRKRNQRARQERQ